MIRDLLHNRELIFTLVKRDLKVRYKASALGFLWSFGKPLFLMLIMTAVFSHIVGIETPIPYTLHILTGLLPWLFLQGSLFEAQNSILANANVVKKVHLPSEAFPTSAVLSNLVHLLLAFIVLSFFIVGHALLIDLRLLPSWEIIFLPFLLLLQTAMLLGIALIVSSLNVFYRDVGSITEIVITAWFYMTPVIYSIQKARIQLKENMGSEALYYLYLSNPMTPIIVGYRRVLYGDYLRYAPEVSDSTLLMGLGVSTLFTVVVLMIGTSMFRRLSRKFADEL
jgi:lipopolysaccharide transport system permease protein